MSEGLAVTAMKLHMMRTARYKSCPPISVKAPADLGISTSVPMTFEVPKDAPAEVKEIALEGGCSAGTARWKRRRGLLASLTFWINTRRITRKDHMTSRRACALHSALCALDCG